MIDVTVINSVDTTWEQGDPVELFMVYFSDENCSSSTSVPTVGARFFFSICNRNRKIILSAMEKPDYNSLLASADNVQYT